jgi:DNA-binding PadR family transcriptional regulator
VLVLAQLLAEPEAWHYGYALSRRTGLRSGTLYPILVRLAALGWLETRWDPPAAPGRPPRHTYRLTAAGARAAAGVRAGAPRGAPAPRPAAGTAGG